MDTRAKLSAIPDQTSARRELTELLKGRLSELRKGEGFRSVKKEVPGWALNLVEHQQVHKVPVQVLVRLIAVVRFEGVTEQYAYELLVMVSPGQDGRPRWKPQPRRREQNFRQRQGVRR